jgi:hypothetical protein
MTMSASLDHWRTFEFVVVGGGGDVVDRDVLLYLGLVVMRWEVALRIDRNPQFAE